LLHKCEFHEHRLTDIQTLLKRGGGEIGVQFPNFSTDMGWMEQLQVTQSSKSKIHTDRCSEHHNSLKCVQGFFFLIFYPFRLSWLMLYTGNVNESLLSNCEFHWNRSYFTHSILLRFSPSVNFVKKSDRQKVRLPHGDSTNSLQDCGQSPWSTRNTNFNI
jgi:hypothetical protein